MGEPLPVIISTQQLGALLGLGRSRICGLQKENALVMFEVLPRIGNRPRYSGKKVQQWLDGELAPGQTYGGPQRRRWPGATPR